MATVTETTGAADGAGQVRRRLAELVRDLGDIPLERILLDPAPGTATEEDLIRINGEGEHKCIELVHATIVEKAVGFEESRLAMRLAMAIESFAEKNGRLGIVAGADGFARIAPNLVRIPDVGFYLRSRLPGGVCPQVAVIEMAPDLAVEVKSRGNTHGEMEDKRREYFDAGVTLVWEVYPRKKVVCVYTSCTEFCELTLDDELDGGSVLPGFRLSIQEWFDKALG